MPKKIKISIGERTFLVELLDQLAPRTCTFLWNALPLESDAHHAKIAGYELFFGFRKPLTEDGPLEKKDYIYDMKPGEVAVAGYTMILCYGEMRHEPFPITIIARVTDNFEEFREACGRAFRKPGERIKITKVC